MQLFLVLQNLKVADDEFSVFALSPSPKTISDFDSEISQLITEFGKRNIAIINKMIIKCLSTDTTFF